MFGFIRTSLFSGAKTQEIARRNLPAIEGMERRVLLSGSPLHHRGGHNDGPKHDAHDDRVLRVSATPKVTTARAGADDKPGHDANDDRGANRGNDNAHDKAEKRHGGQDDPAGHH